MRRLAFFPLCIFFLGGLSIWSFHEGEGPLTRGSVQAQGSPTQDLESRRRALIEWLDRLVSREEYYRQANGRYSRLLGRLGLPLPAALATAYEIQVTEAGQERLQIVALSENDSEAEDRVTIDGNYQLRANFPVPAPRPGYLRYVALKTLRALQARPEAVERSSYRDFFRYERKQDSQQRIVARATGLRDPIQGESFELGPSGLSGGTESEIVAEAFDPALSIPVGIDEGDALLRRAFEGDLGRPPLNPEELALFSGVKRAPASAQPEVEAVDAPLEVDRAPASALVTAPNSSKTQGNFQSAGLEIESIPKDN